MSRLLAATPETVHWGYLDARLPPVMRVASGDTFTIETLTGGPGEIPAAELGFAVPAGYAAIHATHKPHFGRGHLLTGPVWVEGAEPGDALEIRILEIEFGQDYGWNLMRPLLGTLPEDFPRARTVYLPIDRAARTTALPWGGTLPLAPFFGVMAVAPPPAYGVVSTVEPREFGGNIDLKELVAGSTLHLPVWAEGALFSVGDGHGAQGDGEVNLTALETALTGSFEVILHKRSALRFPRAETPTHLITLGLDPDLDDAAKQAVREMIKLLGEVAGLGPDDAYSLCSLACDFRVTQLVDGNKGVHGMLPRSVLPCRLESPAP